MPAPIKAYCDYILDPRSGRHELHKYHHDVWHGFPAKNDRELFGRLIMEINQAGLSWLTILKKEKTFWEAYSGFDIAKVARYKAKDRQRLLKDPGVIRNRLKVDAAIHNANVLLRIQNEHGSFKRWLDSRHPKPVEEWVKIFRETFRFTGYEIVNEFMMSTGYLPGAHHKKCPVYKKIMKCKPAWSRAKIAR